MCGVQKGGQHQYIRSFKWYSRQAVTESFKIQVNIQITERNRHRRKKSCCLFSRLLDSCKDRAIFITQRGFILDYYKLNVVGQWEKLMITVYGICTYTGFLGLLQSSVAWFSLVRIYKEQPKCPAHAIFTTYRISSYIFLP